MGKYLYGASVQGIQGFIFETNKLQEIVGASDLIEWFCSEAFLGKFSNQYNIDITQKAVVRNAGANIRIVFSNRDELKQMVKYFPQYIMQQAYGITLSQAVVEFKDKEYLNKKDELEHKLTKARNQATTPLDARFALMRQTPRTGKPAYEFKNKEYFDKGNWQKKDNREEARVNILLGKLKLNDSFEKFPLDMDKIANDNNKIAIIHADGNKMGLMLQQMNKGLKEKSAEEIQRVFKDFSTAITKSTNDAVKKAFEDTFSQEDKIIKFRPIVIGGDDVTVICDADKALAFTEVYLKEFEKNTKSNFAPIVSKFKLEDFKNGLTACAGVAFCNKKFPFHYAYDLAEHLCGYAKKESSRKASCLVFHNIQSSFVEDYKSYIKEELTARASIEYLVKLKKLNWSDSNKKLTLRDFQYHYDEFCKNIKLSFAPYYTEQEPKIDTLIELHKLFSDSDVPLGKYREWLSELHKSQEYAELFLERVDSILKSKIGNKYEGINNKLQELNSNLKLSSLIVDNKTPIQDILQLKAVIGGTK